LYASDRAEPPHVHVERNDGIAKFWLDPVRLQSSGGFSRVALARVEKLVSEHQSGLLEAWNECSAVDIELPLAQAARVTQDTLHVDLADGRTISVPLAWYPRQLHATAEERQNWRLVGKGRGIHWEAIDEDIGVDGLLAGRPSAESQA
jgi:hypothetical protein